MTLARIRNALTTHVSSPLPTIERALRDHLLSFEAITCKIGKAVFCGRIPKSQKPAIGVKLLTISSVRHPDLDGESGMVHSVIQVDVMSRLHDAHQQVREVSEMVRIATAGPCYRGYLGPTIFCHGITTERDAHETPTSPIDSGHGWHFQYSQDLRITHNQIEV